jgi:ubiquinone/menaquinone biosynthesis C-methylase UbiE
VSSEPIDYRGLGLRDACRGGWYLNDTAELCKGFAIAPTDTVVDVGCGDGGNAGFCARFAARVIAVDIDPASLAKAESRLQKDASAAWETMVSAANPLPIDTATADKLVCTEVLEHVDDPAQVLSELVRIGKAGALYLLSVPDPLSESVMKRVAPASAFRRPNHIRVVQREEFARMVEDAGLIIKTHAYRAFYWTIWYAFAWKCLPDLDHGRHPVLDHWAQAWEALLDHPDGQACVEALNEAMPKSQVIIAAKP